MCSCTGSSRSLRIVSSAAAAIAGVLVERLPERADVVERKNERRVGDLLQRAEGERVFLPEALGARDHVQRHGVMPAVIAALELDQQAPSGGRACQAYCVKG